MDYEHAESRLATTLAVAAAVLTASVALSQLPTPNTVGVARHTAVNSFVAPRSILHFPR